MPDNPLAVMVSRLRSRAPIGDAAEAALLGLPYVLRQYEPPAYIIREGSTEISYCSLIVSGYAFRQKLTTEGLRQIVSLHLRGDLLDLQHLFLQRADHSVEALTPLETLNIERQALQDLLLEEPSIGRALWIDALIEGSMFREWIMNIGRRSSQARVAHLLCEFATRMKEAGLGDGQSCRLPMTQEQIGDAVGLTSVHVNRTLKALEHAGVIQRNKREIAFTDWQAIRQAGQFTSLYLHLEQAEAAAKSGPA